jgi:hypothetical protein
VHPPPPALPFLTRLARGASGLSAPAILPGSAPAILPGGPRTQAPRSQPSTWPPPVPPRLLLAHPCPSRRPPAPATPPPFVRTHPSPLPAAGAPHLLQHSAHILPFRTPPHTASPPLPGQARLTVALPHPIDFNSSYNVGVAICHLLPALAAPTAPRGPPTIYFYTRPADEPTKPNSSSDIGAYRSAHEIRLCLDIPAWLALPHLDAFRWLLRLLHWLTGAILFLGLEYWPWPRASTPLTTETSRKLSRACGRQRRACATHSRGYAEDTAEEPRWRGRSRARHGRSWIVCALRGVRSIAA